MEPVIETDYWATNPGPSLAGIRKMPAKLRAWWMKKRGGKKAGRRNPWEQLHYPKRTSTTPIHREAASGRFFPRGQAKAKGRPAPGRNPGPGVLAVLNPHSGRYKILNKLAKKRGKGGRRNPPGFLGGMTGLFPFLPPLPMAGGVVVGLAVDRQLSRRVVGMIPFPAWVPEWGANLASIAIRVGLLGLLPAWALYKWVNKGFGVGHFLGVAGSSLVSGFEWGLRKVGITTVGDAGTEISGDPLGWFAPRLGEGHGEGGAPALGYYQTRAHGGMGDTDLGDSDEVGDVEDIEDGEGGDYNTVFS